MVTDPILPVVRALLQLAAGPARKQAQRRHQVVKVLKAAGLAGSAPPPDFRSVYAWALAEYGVGKPASVVKLLASDWVRVPFEPAFASGDWSRVRAVLQEVVDGNPETRQFPQLHRSDVKELDGFVEEFKRQVAATRSPAHVASDLKLDRLLDRVEQASNRQEAYRQRREPERRELTSLQRLGADIAEWLRALGYPVLEHRDDEALWIVRAPVTPGRYGRLVIIAVDGELQPSHVVRAKSVQQREAADGAWVIAQRRISPAASADGAVLCLTFDDLVALAADFEPYLDWLDREAERLGLQRRYVRLSCRRDDPDAAVSSDYDWRTGGLDEYAHRWLADPAKEHLSVLGEFGSGKSWFSLHLAWELARLWRTARDRGLPRPRLPLLIPLRDYAKAADIDAVVSKFLYEQDLRLGMPVFQYLNRTGRLLLIFDGFDEMAARVDRHTMAANFWELAKIVEPGAKVLLSSRTEHFPTAEETRRVLTGEVYAAAVPPDGEAPRFDIVELLPLDDEQIGLVLRGRTADEEVIKLVTRNSRLRDLLRRPVMSDLVLTALPEIRAGEAIDVARIYLYAIRHKLDEDIKAERTFTSRADKLYFLCELAWEMVSTSTLSMNYRAFPDRVRSFFGGAIAAEREFDHWVHDMQAQSLLIRDASGDYTPAHRSLLEWLVAFKFAGELGLLHGPFLELLGTVSGEGAPARWSEYFTSRDPHGRLPPITGFTPEPVQALARTFGEQPMDYTVAGFLRSMVAEHPEGSARLLEVARATGGVPPGESGLVGANCVATLGRSAERRPLAGAVLTGLTRTFFANLHDADLRGADLRGVKLSRVTLSRSDLRGALLDPAPDLADQPAARQLAVAATGEVVIGDSVGAEVWSGDDLTERPGPVGRVFYKAVRLDRGVRLLALSGSRIHLGADHPEMIDVATGERAPTRALEWAIAVDWRGVPAFLVDGREDDAVDVVARADLTTIGRLPRPPLQRRHSQAALSYAPGTGICCILRAGNGFEVQGYEQPGGWGPVISWPAPAAGRTWIVGRYLWIEPEPGRPVLHDLRGTPLWTPRDRVARAGRDEQPVFLVAPEQQLILVSGADELTAWPLSGGSPLWRADLLGGAASLVPHPDGRSFVYLTHADEVGRRATGTGEVITRALLHGRFREATFSAGCGLSAATLDVLELGGARVSAG